jgi:glycine betaine/proline transport system ATP-binding protein
MLMDEAFSALDPLIRTEMQDELLKLQEERAHHHLHLARSRRGHAHRRPHRHHAGRRVVQVGTPEEILKNPANDYVRSFFRGVDVSKVLTAGDIARTQAGDVIEREARASAGRCSGCTTTTVTTAMSSTRQQRFHGVVSVDLAEGALRWRNPLGSADPR